MHLAWDAFIQSMLSGQYFEAHEILEAPWRETKDRRLQTAIWVAAAYVHLDRQNPSGARRILTRILAVEDLDDRDVRRCIQARLSELDQGLAPIPPNHALLVQLRRWVERDN